MKGAGAVFEECKPTFQGLVHILNDDLHFSGPVATGLLPDGLLQLIETFLPGPPLILVELISQEGEGLW